MPLNLTRRLVKGEPLTAADHDDNLDKIEAAIEDQSEQLADLGVDAAALLARLNAFRNSRKIYVSLEGNNLNNGTSEGEPLRTLAAAAAAAQPGDVVFLSPGTYVEAALPIRWRRGVTVFGSGLRSTIVRPAAGQEYKDIFKVDSGFWTWGISFAGHQADSTQNLQSWAVSYDELADNRDIGAVGLGAFILASPYIQNCTSITAEDDAGAAGSQSTGDSGGGIKVDGDACAINSPIRSMVVDSYTQVNLGGPGCLVKNDGYAQLVSFFGTFCTYHVQTQTGGQVNLSGGGTTDFGVYGLIADGYSPAPLYTAQARTSYYGAARLERAVTIDPATDLLTSTAHTLQAGDQITLSASQGTLPAPLESNTTYFVVASGLTANAFKISTNEGGAAINITGTATGAYQLLRQGATVVDVVSLTANRLGRQIKYPTAGSLGSPGSPVTVSARGGSTAGSTFTVTLAPSTIVHEYVAGGVVTLGNVNYEIESAVYNNTTGVTVLTACGYAPTVGDSITLSGLSFICASASRPNTGQLMFPQLVFPRNASTGAAQAKTFAYTRTGDFSFTYSEAPSPSGPDHEYVSGGSVVIDGTNYGVANAVYNKTTGLVTITTQTLLPAGNGNVTVSNLRFICPTSAYVVTSSVPIDANGNEVNITASNRAGFRVYFYSGLNGGLGNDLEAGQILDFRNRSQIAAPGHTFEYVGAGTNYDALPWNGGVPNPANRVVETNNGRVYTSNTDELGNFAVGDQFSVDGTTGSVTINTDQFNLSGLNAIGPFSRNGGFSTVGVQLREISNNTSLIASTGAPDGNTAPTQFAVKEFVGSRYVTTVTAASGQPISVSGSPQVDGTGTWSYDRSITLQLNVADGLVRLDGSALVPRALLPAATTSAAGSMSAADKAKLDGIAAGAEVNVNADWNATSGDAQILNKPAIPAAADAAPQPLGVAAIGTSTDYAREDHVHALPPVATPSTNGLMAAADKTKVDGLGTAAFTSSTAYATAAQGATADTAFAERLRWDGGGTGLIAATGRTSLELGSAAVLNAGTSAGNVPVLDSGGKITAAVLPSYVDDVLEFANLAGFPATGETGKIYAAIDTGKIYRWSGSAYVEISPSPGSTDSVPEGTTNLYFTTPRAAAAAPVQSVAGRTGAVTLSANDISGLGAAATLNVGTTAGTVAAGDDPRFAGAVSIGLAAGLSIALG